MIEIAPDVQPGADYLAPTTIEEAVTLLAARGEEAKLLAGGQSLLVLYRLGLVRPSALIGLKAIPELRRIEATPEGGLTIGAMTTQHDLETSPIVRERFPILAEAAESVASPLVRRQGTIGGNLCHGDPTSDPPAALIALGAEVELARAGGRRRLPVEALFADYMETMVASDELLVTMHIPAPSPGTGAAYVKHRLRGVDTALVGVGVGLTLGDDGRCRDARVGLVGVGLTPLRAAAAEAALRGGDLTDDALAAAAEAASAECAPLSDTEGSEWYRREMVKVHLRRAAAKAVERARSAL